MNDFEKYQLAKSQFDIQYRGYALNRVLALQLWQYANNNHPFKLRQVAKIIRAYNFEDLFFEATKHKILSTFGRYNRKDHLTTYNNVISMLGSEVSANIMITPRRCFHINFKILYFVLHKCLPVINVNNMGSMFALMMEMIFWCNTIDKLIKKDFSGVEKYLCFCDSLDLENLLTQHFKMHGVQTFSLSHGTYHIIHKTPEPGIIAYENLETEHLLLWGQYSVDEFISWGINKNRLYCAGYPKLNKMIYVKPLIRKNRCIVLLSQHYFFELNMKLLKMLSCYTDKIDFTVKPHPASVEYYKEFAYNNGMNIVNSNETIQMCLDQDKFDWCISVNTGAYFDALMRGVRCLRYSDGSFDMQPGCDDVFENREQFEVKYNKILNMPMDLYQKEVKNALRYAFGIGINNYRAIILGK